MRKKSIKMNFIMNSILTISSMIFPLITFPYISRALQPAGIGKVNFAISVISYFTMFAQLGIPTYGIRACAQVRDDKKELSKVVQELLIISVIMCTLSYIALFMSILIIPRFRQDALLFVITGTAVLLNTIGVEWLYKGLEQYSYITIRSLIFKVIGIIAMIVLVHKPSDYIIYGGITVIASYASFILNFLHLKRYISLRPIRNLNFKRHMKPILEFFAMSCATTIYTNLDTIMLAFMVNDDAVGYYSAAVKIKGILVGVVTSLGTVLLPRASYYVENHLKNEFLGIAKKALSFVIIIAVPLMIYFIIFAKEGIFFLSGESFKNSILPMQIIMPTIVLIGLSNVMGIQMLIPLGNERVVLISVVCGAIVDLLVNIALIPVLGAAGASVGTLIAELIVCIVQHYALSSIDFQVYKYLPLKQVFIGCLISSACCIWVKFLNFGSFFTLMISAIIFFGTYLIILTIKKEPLILDIDRQILKKLKLI